MNISILLPTRRRLDHLRQSLHSLVALATEPDELELLLFTDDDDAPASPVAKEVFPWKRVIERRGPRFGYDKAHLYYNHLADCSTGQLLFIWNDDTRMLTQGWDSLLMALRRTIIPPRIQFLRRDISHANDFTFPTVDRRIFEAMGHLSLHCYVDSWLQRVSIGAQVDFFRPDIVFHHHRLADEVQKDNARAVNGPEGHAKFFAMDKERNEDIHKIQDLVRNAVS